MHIRIGNFHFGKLPEARESIENPSVPLSSDRAFEIVFGEGFQSSAGKKVTTEEALKVPALFCAVNFLSQTIASLPLHVRNKDETKVDDSKLGSVLRGTVNEDLLTSYMWRKNALTNVLLRGRSVTYIERNKGKEVVNLWPLDNDNLKIEKKNGMKRYIIKESGKTKIYKAHEVIDIVFMYGVDGFTHVNPISKFANAIGLALAMEDYAGKFFQNGAVPPLALEGPLASAGAVRRATAAVDEAVKDATREKKNMFYLPEGFKISTIGFKPDESQLTEGRLFQLQEISRMYNLPPAFLNDLTNGTYSNVEQQDLNFVKHALSHWINQIEEELNAKLFARNENKRYIEFNVDGLLRGEFKSRMEGYATSIQNSLMTPDEARELEGRPAMGGNATKLFINSASVPIDDIDKQPEETPAPELEEEQEEENPNSGDEENEDEDEE